MLNVLRCHATATGQPSCNARKGVNGAMHNQVQSLTKAGKMGLSSHCLAGSVVSTSEMEGQKLYTTLHRDNAPPPNICGTMKWHIVPFWLTMAKSSAHIPCVHECQCAPWKLADGMHLLKCTPLDRHTGATSNPEEYGEHLQNISIGGVHQSKYLPCNVRCQRTDACPSLCGPVIEPISMSIILSTTARSACKAASVQGNGYVREWACRGRWAHEEMGARENKCTGVSSDHVQGPYDMQGREMMLPGWGRTLQYDAMAM